MQEATEIDLGELRRKIIKTVKGDITDDIGACGIVSDKTSQEVGKEIVDEYLRRFQKGVDLRINEKHQSGKESDAAMRIVKDMQNVYPNVPKEQFYPQWKRLMGAQIKIGSETITVEKAIRFIYSDRPENAIRDTNLITNVFQIIQNVCPDNAGTLTKKLNDDIIQTVTNMYQQKKGAVSKYRQK